MRDAYLLAGPTASGKSAIAATLAREMGAWILSADSMNVYRGMDVGTAKPSAEERAEFHMGGVDVKATVARANTLLENLNAFALDLKEGKGTIGRLAQDPKLYDEVNALMHDVRQVIDNYRDTTPITTFSSLAAGAF